ncbi:MAG: hypothetical protein R3Y63_14650, partial [Eubacteriales bacterium]
VQDLVGPSEIKGKSQFQVLMNKLPDEHKARWFAGSALKGASPLGEREMSRMWLFGWKREPTTSGER